MLFGSTALEVAIGMVFVYLLLSLLCSAINEYIEAKLNYRATNLKKGIELLLTGGVKDLDVVKEFGVIKGRSTEDNVGKEKPTDAAGGKPSGQLVQDFYNHGLIKALYKDGDTLPSYIPARTFTLALWNLAGDKAGGDTTDLKAIKDLISTPGAINEDLRQALVTLIDDAQGDFEKARKNVEDWYDAAMDRVSGWYKRRAQKFLLVIGFVLAVLINADTVNIAKALMQDSALRASIVASAEKFKMPAETKTADGKPLTPEQQSAQAATNIGGIRAELRDLGLPIGWAFDKDYKVDPRGVPQRGEITSASFFNVLGWGILKIFGLALTGLAISQGAPFWFDVLNKFMVIRSTVKPREKSPEEKSKDAVGNDPKKDKTGNDPNKDKTGTKT
jgi:hypothetical protein